MKDYDDFDAEKAKSEFTDEKARAEFERGSKEFSKEDVETLIQNEEEIHQKFNTGPLQKFVKQFSVLMDMIKDYTSGAYKEIPWMSIAGIGATLLYVFSPIDFIPDIIPVLGLVDDAAVVAICLAALNEDLKKYKDWKKNQ